MGAPQQLRQDAKRTNSGKRRVPALSPLLLLFLPSSQRVALALIACCCHSAVHAKGSWTAGVAYTGEVWSVVSGGLGDDMRSLANLDLTFEADLEDAIGWTGATVFAYGLYNNDSSISELAGDVQTVSNIETGVETFRLYEAWLEQRVGEKASIKIGLYDLNSEFDALETAGLFINSAHGIGSDIGLTGENGPSIFPVTSLGARLEYGFASDWAVRLAVLDGVPGDPDRPKRTAVRFGDGDGALIAAEVEAPMPHGRVLLGHWRYTSEFEQLDGEMDDGNLGVYLRAERRLWSEPGTGELNAGEPNAGKQGLAGFARAGWSKGDINPYNVFLGGGLVYTGVFDRRPDDRLGLAVAAAFSSRRFRSLAEVERAEVNVEVTYHLPLTDFFALQPNVQYIVNPSADPALKNALAVGLRAEIGLEF